MSEEILNQNESATNAMTVTEDMNIHLSTDEGIPVC